MVQRLYLTYNRLFKVFVWFNLESKTIAQAGVDSPFPE